LEPRFHYDQLSEECPPAQRAVCKVAYKFWMVVVLTDVAEQQGGHARIKVVLDKLCRYFIREVTAPAHDSLLHGPGIRSYAQHLEIVVRLEKDEICPPKVNAQRIGDVAKVCRDSNLYALRLQGVPDRIHGIMRHGKTRNVNITYCEGASRLETFVYRRILSPLDVWGGTVGEKYGRPALARSGGGQQPGDVITMFMRDQNPVQMTDIFPDGCQPFLDLAAAQSSID
jgi:hypothetical protein